MKIAIISDDGLPDIRVEREIYLLRKIGYDVYFIGPYNYTSLINHNELSAIHNLSFPVKAKLGIPPYSYWVKKRIKKILGEINPDIIIAVNFHVASIVYKLGYPMIFDDHEFNQLLISFRYITNEYQGLSSRIAAIRTLYLMRKNLYRIVSENTTWVISQYFKTVYRALTGNEKIYVLRNYPTIKELNYAEFKELKKPPLNICSIGSFSFKYLKSLIRRLYEAVEILRNIEGFGKEIFFHIFGGKIKDLPQHRGIVFHGYIKKIPKLLDELSRMHVCLVAYLPTPIQAPYSPNKVYHCMVVGGIPIVTDTMIEVVKETRGNVLIVDSINYEESLYKVLMDLKQMSIEEINKLRLRSYNTIRNLTWDNYASIVKSSLSKA